MSVFKDMLSSSETLFKNATALDYDYVPKLIPYRETEQRQIASCIKPLFQKRNGKNLFLFGTPGVGKTVACRKILEELEDETDDIVPIYVNCWKKNTSYKILLEVCESIGYKFTQNKKTDELFLIVKKIINNKSAVFVFDEVDKLEDYDFLYFILEDIYRKSIILITNMQNWLSELDTRIKSRLVADVLEFKPYNLKETQGILDERREYAFYNGVFDEDAFALIVNKTYELNDIRMGLYLMKESANLAEEMSSKKIRKDNANKAIDKLNEFSIKKTEEIEYETQIVLDIVKCSQEQKIGDLFKAYLEKGGTGTYKTFQRKVAFLVKNKFVSAVKIVGGKEGTTTVISSKKITDY